MTTTRSYDGSSWVFRATDDLSNLDPGNYYYGVWLDLESITGSDANCRYDKTDQKPYLWEGIPVTGTVLEDTDHNLVTAQQVYTGPLTVVAKQNGVEKKRFECNSGCNGSYTLKLKRGTYDISVEKPYGPEGYEKVTRVEARPDTWSSRSVSIPPSATNIDFIVQPVWVEGNIFVDYDRNGQKHPSLVPTDPLYEPLYNQPVTVTHDGADTVDFSNTVVSKAVTIVTGDNGHYKLTYVPTGDRTLALTPITGFNATKPNPLPQTITILPLTGQASIDKVDIAIAPVYSIQGFVFDDRNKNGLYNPSPSPDVKLPFSLPQPNSTQLQIEVTEKSPAGKLSEIEYVYNNSSAEFNYKVINLFAGKYEVSVINRPSNYASTFPQAGKYIVRVGTDCKNTPPDKQNPTPLYPNAAGDPKIPIGSCYDEYATPPPTLAYYRGESYKDLNLGLTNEHGWFMAVSGDMRIDSGFSDPIPAPIPVPLTTFYASIAKNTNEMPGVVFTGDKSSSFCYGNQVCLDRISPSPFGWLVGGTIFPDLFAPSTGLWTRYSNMENIATQNGIPVNNLPCTFSNCTLGNNFNNGVYKANGNLTLNSHTFKKNKDYVILVNGNLVIKGDIKVPNGSTVTFSVSGDIIIDKTVGVDIDHPEYSCDVQTGANCNIEGFYSADGSIIVETEGKKLIFDVCQDNANSKDKRINLAGSIVANAKQNDGSFQMNRTLCKNDLLYPSLTITQRSDLILNAPDYIKTRNTLWQEVVP